MKKRYLLPVITCIVCSTFPGLAQDAVKENYFNHASVVGRIHYGFLLAHRPRIEHLVRHTYGFEISLSRQTNGSKLWQQYYRYPQTGFTYIFLNFNDPGVLGYAHGFMAFINLPLVIKEQYRFSFRMASGLGYVTRKYERVENYKNDVIGSNLNAALQFNFENRFRLSRHLLFNFNIGLTHFSNGSFRVPNLGINNPSANAGLTYQVHPSPELIRSDLPAIDKRIQVDVLYAAGIKENYPPEGQKFFAHTLSSTAMKAVGHKVRLGLGLDIFYDLGLRRQFEWEGKPITNDSKMLRSGIHFDHELMIENLSVLVQMGAYWLDQYKGDGSLYHRIGFKYSVSRHLFINLTLKTHWAKADYVETGLGWKFKKDHTKSTQVSESNNNETCVRFGYADLQFRKIK